MKIYALLHYKPETFALDTYKEFRQISRCLIWADSVLGIEAYIATLREKTQCRELVLATPLFQGDCEHPAFLEQILPEDEIKRLIETITKCGSYIDGIMFGNAGCEIAARSLVGFEPDKLTAYVIEILKKCKEYAEKVNKPQWAGIMDGEIVIDSYNHRNLPSKSSLHDFLIPYESSLHIPNQF